MKDLEQMRVSAKDNDDAIRKWIEEFRRRLIRAGLSKWLIQKTAEKDWSSTTVQRWTFLRFFESIFCNYQEHRWAGHNRR